MLINVLDAIIELRRAAARAAAITLAGDISAKQTSVLRELRTSGPVSQIALARSTASDPAFMVRILDDLEQRGLVRRQRNPTDRREMAVSLTARGRKALGPLDAALQQLADAAEADLDEGERRVFLALAEKIIGALGHVSHKSARKQGDHEHR